MRAALLLLAIAVCPHVDAVETRCDRLEVNHVYAGDGRLVFDQLIAWDWNAAESRWDVVDWRMIKDVRRAACKGKDELPPVGRWHPSPMVPRRIPGGYACDFYDEKSRGILRRIKARFYIETWTAHDREVDHREVLPQERRRGL